MGPVGRVLRFVLGAYLVLLALPYYLFPGRSVSLLGSTYSSNYIEASFALVASLGFFAFYVAIHRASEGPLRGLAGWTGAAIANIPPLVVFIVSPLLGVSFPQIAVFTYVGLAMILAGWRMDEGCEVMSPANAIFRRSTNFACVVFSPIDWAEKKAHSAKNGNTSSFAAQPSSL